MSTVGGWSVDKMTSPKYGGQLPLAKLHKCAVIHTVFHFKRTPRLNRFEPVSCRRLPIKLTQFSSYPHLRLALIVGESLEFK